MLPTKVKRPVGLHEVLVVALALVAISNSVPSPQCQAQQGKLHDADHAPADPPDSSIRKSKTDPLNGKWEVRQSYRAGKTLTKEDERKRIVVFLDGVMTLPKQPLDSLSYHLDATSKPKTITYTARVFDKPYEFRGIYELSDSTLTLVLNEWPNGPRPTQISPVEPEQAGAPATHRRFLVLQRIDNTQDDVGVKAKPADKTRGSTNPLEAVFVFADQERTAQNFAKLLKPRRINTTIVPAYDLEEELFVGKDLIIIGADTTRVWGYKATDDVIRNVNLPVLAMGEGGYKLFGELKLDFSDLELDRGEQTSIRRVKEAIFWDGFRLQPTEAGAYNCYAKSRHISIQLSEPDPKFIPIAREATRHEHYPLIAQKPYYFFWGFDGTTDQMTDTGRILLPWACHYTVAMKRNPIRAFAKTSEVDQLKSKESGQE